jgi:hypothetical protein
MADETTQTTPTEAAEPEVEATPSATKKFRATRPLIFDGKVLNTDDPIEIDPVCVADLVGCGQLIEVK